MKSVKDTESREHPPRVANLFLSLDKSEREFQTSHIFLLLWTAIEATILDLSFRQPPAEVVCVYDIKSVYNG